MADKAEARARLLGYTSVALAPPKQNPLVEGLDYYRESGNVVFTPRFLLKRGFCCNSSCRHCPYRQQTAASLAIEIRGLGAADES